MAIKINGVTVISDSQAITTTSTISATGNVTAGNVSVVGTVVAAGINTGSSPVSTTGNVTAGNVITTGLVSATGNIVGNFILGNGSQLTGIDATSIQNGTSNVKVVSSGGNVTTSVGGTANVLVVASSGTVTTGTASVSGNITGGNVAATNLTGTNVSVTGTATAASTVGGVITGTSASVSGTVTAASTVGGVITGTSASVSGTVTAASTVGGVITGTSSSLSGNVTGGNILTAGQVSATGNITGGAMTINGNAVITGNLRVDGTETIFNTQSLTVNDLDIIVANNVTGGANVNGAGLQAGNPAVATWFFNNATTSWQSNIGITPTTNGTLSLGGASNYWGTAFVTTASVTGNVQGGNLRTAGLVSATGSITGASVVGGVMTGSSLSVTGAVTAASTVGGVITGSSASVSGTVTAASTVGGVITGSSASVTGAVTAASTVGGVITGSSASVTGAVTGASANFSTGAVSLGSITNNNANGVGNIGSTGTRFNTVFATATSAQYADLAEKYTADADYAPGTVVMFGGTAEVTLCVNDACARVAGVISTNPSYRMNDGLESEHTAMVALTGRVPTKVTGTVRKGDMMVSAGNGVARAEANPAQGTVIGKSLADFDGVDGVIEVVVGRL